MSAYLLLLMIIGAWLMPQCTVGQVPTACADDDSLENLRCCPTTADGVCGADANRGQCAELNIDGYSETTTDVRANWPHYFTQVCQCNGNYSGYDCSRCKFGHYGPDCSQSQILPRRPIASYTDEQWQEFVEIIQMLRTYDSDYTAILEESIAGNSNLKMTNITLYKLYVWLHHYAARDSYTLGNINSRTDYAHSGPAFTTWHRYFNIWFEWEIQYMLKNIGHLNYYSFRLPYWDWRIEIQKSTGIPAEELFTESRFGATQNISGFPRVVGDIVEPDGWDSVCIQTQSVICDPNINTGLLQRCPFTGNNPCSSDNPDWPTMQLVNDALAIDTYDSPPYNLLSRTGYRPFVDFDIHDDYEECSKDRMCRCLPVGGSQCNLTDVPPIVPVFALNSQLHSDAHFIIGVGDFDSDIPVEQYGQIYDPGASPNDPIFIVHHTMVDCMFDEWLRRHPDEEYPDVPLTTSTQGHQAHSYMVPFIPVYTNADMFKPAYNFGYYCNLSNITTDSGVVDSGSFPTVQLTLFTWFSVIFISLAVMY